MKPIDCFISGHYYKADSDTNQETFYVKCQRCNKRILIHDKSYHGRKEGTYKL
jgi:DNA-directed RNA polymerase subunit RPC12/RpoP